VSKIGALGNEKQFLKSMFEIDSKNYHAWLYIRWLVKHFNAWAEEIVFVKKMISQDVRNNSAWAYRMFLVVEAPSEHQMPIKDHVNDAFEIIRLAPSNESPWLFLRGSVVLFLNSSK
jgi:protein farnesyltransferase/geranylgeranyltransferase type-1 subunit alpha